MQALLCDTEVGVAPVLTPSVNPTDAFTIDEVLAKTNAALFNAPGRSTSREKQTHRNTPTIQEWRLVAESVLPIK
eukprot:7335547-Pyramimonas_sp.AAC.1